MKTRIYSITLFAILFFFVTTGCKKESASGEASLDPPALNERAALIEKIKTWYENKRQSGERQRNEYFLWESTEQIGHGINITPVSIGGIESSNRKKIYKLFVTLQDLSGEIISGNYILYIPKENYALKQPDDLNLQIASYVRQNNSNLNDLNGAIFKYDLQYNLIDAKNYSNGQSEDNTVKLTSKQDGKLSKLSLAEIPCGTCIDWYLQTYDIETGEILSEIYLYTECGHQGCEGSGGGGDGSSVPQSVYNGLMQLVNSITVSNETKSVTTLSESPEQRIKRLEWKLVKGIGWYIYSWEKGLQVKVASQNPGTQWQWQSITHEGSAKVGVIVGGSVSHNITYWNATLGLYNAIVDVQLAVTCSVGWRGSPISYDLTYPCQKNFNVNESYE